jgi:hypothetical protein
MVMVPFMRHIIVLRLGAEMSSLSKTGLAKQIERAINGGQPDVRVFFGEEAVHRLGGDVFHFQEHAEDLLALAGELQLMLGEVILEEFDFLGTLVHQASKRN